MPVTKETNMSHGSRGDAGAVYSKRIFAGKWIVWALVVAIVMQIGFLVVGMRGFSQFRSTKTIAMSAPKFILIERDNNSLEEIRLVDHLVFTASVSRLVNIDKHMSNVHGMSFNEYYSKFSHKRPGWCQGENYLKAVATSSETPQLSQSAFGWPMRWCVRTSSSSRQNALATWNQFSFDELSWLGQQLQSSGVVFWSSFVVNTIATAIPVLLLLRVRILCRLIAEWNRRRKGLCTHCAYPIRDLKKCPECGKRIEESQLALSATDQ